MGNCVCKQPRCQVHPLRRNKNLKIQTILNWQWASQGPMTQEQFERLRDSYWKVKIAEETVEQPTWITLHDIVFALIEGRFDEAQTIMNESNLFTPHGDLTTVLDFDGNVFEVAPYAINCPINMVIMENESQKSESGIGSNSGSPAESNTSTDAESMGESSDKYSI